MEVGFEVTMDYGDRLEDDDAIPTESDLIRWIQRGMAAAGLKEPYRVRVNQR